MATADDGRSVICSRQWSQGDEQAREDLVPLVYEELRQRAAACLRGERRDHTLQPTALVNEAYLRLMGQRARDVAATGRSSSASARASCGASWSITRASGRRRSVPAVSA